MLGFIDPIFINKSLNAVTEIVYLTIYLILTAITHTTH